MTRRVTSGWWALAVALAIGGSLPAYADESLQTLLETYRKASDLSKRTKKENAGYVVVYTRDDLEKMQIYRLSDILRELRFVRYNLNNFGMQDPIHIDPFFYSSDMIKLYVNDHEISSGYSGSGLQYYGNVDMGMFDHVEVYYGAPIFDIATEPSAILIKLYTKDPARENGGALVGRLGDRGTQESYLYHGQSFEKWSYFAYAEEAKNNFKPTRHDWMGRGFELSRDYSQQHLYLDLHDDKSRIEGEYLRQTHDPFTAQSLTLTPTGGDWKEPVFRLSATTKALDEHITATLSWIHSSTSMGMDSFGPFWGEMLLYRPDEMPLGNRFSLHVTGNLVTGGLHYEHPWGEKHLFKVGMEYRYKDGKLTNYRFNDRRLPDRRAHMRIHSLYLQDQYTLHENMMLALSLKANAYDFKTDSLHGKDASLNTWQGRAAFSTIQGAWRLKAFVTHMEFPTQLYVLLLHDYPLVSQTHDAVSGEIRWSDTTDDIRFFGSYSWYDHVILLNPLAPMTARQSDLFETVNLSFDYSHHFNTDHRIDANINWTHIDNAPYDIFDKTFYGGFVRLLDTFGNIDLFNEVIYREKTRFSDAGWDYSAGMIYHITPDLSVSIKGVNLLDDAQEQPFLYSPDLSTLNTANIPIVGKQFYVSMEWLF